MGVVWKEVGVAYGDTRCTNAVRTASRAELVTWQNRERQICCHRASSRDLSSKVGTNWDSSVSGEHTEKQ